MSRGALLTILYFAVNSFVMLARIFVFSATPTTIALNSSRSVIWGSEESGGMICSCGWSNSGTT